MQLNGREIKKKGSRGKERDNIRYTPVAHYVIPNPIFASGRPTNTLRLVNHTHIFDLLQSNQIESFAGFNSVCPFVWQSVCAAWWPAFMCVVVRSYKIKYASVFQNHKKKENLNLNGKATSCHRHKTRKPTTINVHQGAVVSWGYAPSATPPSGQRANNSQLAKSLVWFFFFYIRWIYAARLLCGIASRATSKNCCRQQQQRLL